jgi:Fic family protein
LKFSGNLFARTPLRLPFVGGFEPDILIRMEEISLLLPSFRSIEPEQIYRSEARRLDAFSHELSPYFERAAGSPIKKCRSNEEASVLRIWTLSQDDLRGSQTFIQAIARLNRGFLHNKSKLRRDRIFIKSDSEGNAVEFPDVNTTFEQMEWLRQNIKDVTPSHPPLLTAITCLPILTNSHLFFDGNGRVSRAIFNHMLRHIGLPAHVYLPVYEIMIASRGGFLIRLRQIETQNIWEPFVTFILDFLDLCKDIGDR